MHAGGRLCLLFPLERVSEQVKEEDIRNTREQQEADLSGNRS